MRKLLLMRSYRAMFVVGNRTACRGQNHQICVQEIEQRPGESFEDKNKRIGRPESPHATIYKFTIPMIISISHRITGILNASFLCTFAGCALVIPDNFTQVTDWIECLEIPAFVLYPGRFCMALPFIYHVLSGTRLLISITGAGLNNKMVNITGIALLVTSVVATAALVAVLA